MHLDLRVSVETIDWHFRFRGRLIHKVCHFYLMETDDSDTKPQRTEGITACRWARYDDARGAALVRQCARSACARA